MKYCFTVMGGCMQINNTNFNWQRYQICNVIRYAHYILQFTKMLVNFVGATLASLPEGDLSDCRDTVKHFEYLNKIEETSHL